MQITIEVYEAIASFVGGAIFGYVIRILIERTNSKRQLTSAFDNKALEEIVAFVIVCIWTVSMLISTFYPDRHTPLELHLLMGGVFGVLLNKGSNPILDSIVKRVTTTTTNDTDNNTTSKTTNDTTTTTNTK